jgi:hypothetical protein
MPLCPEEAQMPLPSTMISLLQPSFKEPKAVTYLQSQTYKPPSPCALNIVILRNEMKEIQVEEIQKNWNRGIEKGNFHSLGLKEKMNF